MAQKPPSNPLNEKLVMDEIATFVHVVNQGTLAGAARKLKVPKSTISRRLSRLEAALEITLLHKGSRKIHLTSEGKQLFDNVHLSIEHVEQAIVKTLTGGTLPEGNIRISAPHDFGHLLLLDEIVAFKKVWPEITFDIDMSNRFVDVVEEGYDLAVRAGLATNAPGANRLITRKLLTSKLRIAGSSSSNDKIDSLEDLQGQPFVLFRQPSQQQTLELTSDNGRKHVLEVKSSFIVNDYGAMAKLIFEGAGFGLIPELHINHSSCSLKSVLPQYYVPSGSLMLVYPSRQLPRRVSLFIEFILGRLQDLSS